MSGPWSHILWVQEASSRLCEALEACVLTCGIWVGFPPVACPVFVGFPAHFDQWPFGDLWGLGTKKQLCGCTLWLVGLVSVCASGSLYGILCGKLNKTWHFPKIKVGYKENCVDFRLVSTQCLFVNKRLVAFVACVEVLRLLRGYWYSY